MVGWSLLSSGVRSLRYVYLDRQPTGEVAIQLVANLAVLYVKALPHMCPSM
jgi:hypothetical protein